MKQIDMTRRLGFGMLITMVGGMMDAYSYVVRGQVFATGQTGNFVLVAVRLAQGAYLPMLQALVPILSFWVGVFLAQHLLHRVLEGNDRCWRRNILLLEIGLLFLVGWVPRELPHILANTLISLTAAMQFCCFRNFGENAAYATVFCTGNMRACAEMYYQGLVLKRKESLKKAHGYGAFCCPFRGGLFGRLARRGTGCKEHLVRLRAAGGGRGGAGLGGKTEREKPAADEGSRFFYMCSSKRRYVGVPGQKRLRRGA